MSLCFQHLALWNQGSIVRGSEASQTVANLWDTNKLLWLRLCICAFACVGVHSSFCGDINLFTQSHWGDFLMGNPIRWTNETWVRIGVVLKGFKFDKNWLCLWIHFLEINVRPCYVSRSDVNLDVPACVCFTLTMGFLGLTSGLGGAGFCKPGRNQLDDTVQSLVCLKFLFLSTLAETFLSCLKCYGVSQNCS